MTPTMSGSGTDTGSPSPSATGTPSQAMTGTGTGTPSCSHSQASTPSQSTSASVTATETPSVTQTASIPPGPPPTLSVVSLYGDSTTANVLRFGVLPSAPLLSVTASAIIVTLNGSAPTPVAGASAMTLAVPRVRAAGAADVVLAARFASRWPSPSDVAAFALLGWVVEIAIAAPGGVVSVTLPAGTARAAGPGGTFNIASASASVEYVFPVVVAPAALPAPDGGGGAYFTLVVGSVAGGSAPTFLGVNASARAAAGGVLVDAASMTSAPATAGPVTIPLGNETGISSSSGAVPAGVRPASFSGPAMSASLARPPCVGGYAFDVLFPGSASPQTPGVLMAALPASSVQIFIAAGTLMAASSSGGSALINEAPLWVSVVWTPPRLPFGDVAWFSAPVALPSLSMSLLGASSLSALRSSIAEAIADIAGFNGSALAVTYVTAASNLVAFAVPSGRRRLGAPATTHLGPPSATILVSGVNGNVTSALRDAFLASTGSGALLRAWAAFVDGATAGLVQPPPSTYVVGGCITQQLAPGRGASPVVFCPANQNVSNSSWGSSAAVVVTPASASSPTWQWYLLLLLLLALWCCVGFLLLLCCQRKRQHPKQTPHPVLDCQGWGPITTVVVTLTSAKEAQAAACEPRLDRAPASDVPVDAVSLGVVLWLQRIPKTDTFALRSSRRQDCSSGNTALGSSIDAGGSAATFPGGALAEIVALPVDSPASAQITLVTKHGFAPLAPPVLLRRGDIGCPTVLGRRCEPRDICPDGSLLCVRDVAITVTSVATHPEISSSPGHSVASSNFILLDVTAEEAAWAAGHASRVLASVLPAAVELIAQHDPPPSRPVEGSITAHPQTAAHHNSGAASLEMPGGKAKWLAAGAWIVPSTEIEPASSVCLWYRLGRWRAKHPNGSGGWEATFDSDGDMATAPSLLPIGPRPTIERSTAAVVRRAGSRRGDASSPLFVKSPRAPIVTASLDRGTLTPPSSLLGLSAHLRLGTEDAVLHVESKACGAWLLSGRRSIEKNAIAAAAASAAKAAADESEIEHMRAALADAADRTAAYAGASANEVSRLRGLLHAMERAAAGAAADRDAARAAVRTAADEALSEASVRAATDRTIADSAAQAAADRRAAEAAAREATEAAIQAESDRAAAEALVQETVDRTAAEAAARTAAELAAAMAAAKAAAEAAASAAAKATSSAQARAAAIEAARQQAEADAMAAAAEAARTAEAEAARAEAARLGAEHRATMLAYWSESTRSIVFERLHVWASALTCRPLTCLSDAFYAFADLRPPTRAGWF